MSTIIFNDKILKIHTNKAHSIFSSGGKQAYKYIEGSFGIIYSDYDCDKKMINDWKQEKFDKFFINSPRKITIDMDDKIKFHKVMSQSKYTPESYLNLKEVCDKDALYFVKNTAGSGSTGVDIYDYEKLQTVDLKNCIIQKNIDNPHLHNNKRYKIRQLVLLHNKKVYLHKDSFFTMSHVDYTNTEEINVRDKHIIYQKDDTIFELSQKLEDFELIFKNIIDAVRDFKKYYGKQINCIPENEYSILGFDLIVDSDKNVQIIEINHRSNYKHPKNVCDDCDVRFIRDMILVMIEKKTEQTRLIEI